MPPREVPELDEPAARRRAFDLLARRAWTEGDLTARLRRHGAPEAVARAVVADLTARGYVNDAEFARMWAEARARGRKIGRVRLQRELAAMGVAPALIAAALDAAFGEVSERERAREAAIRRLDALTRRSPEGAAARLRDFLLRRGYAATVVRDTVRELTAALDEPGPADDGSV
jgi:regulatory protein